MSLPATHNAMSNRDDGWIAPNQQHGLTAQLQAGIRGMALDTYAWEGDLYLCHGDCILGRQLLVDGLQELTDFLTKQPGAVIALMIEDYISPADTAEAFHASGLDQFLYTADAGPDWPTLGWMVQNDQRVVVTAESGGPPPLWYHHAWDVFWDTPYAFTSIEEMSCELNRGAEGNELFLMNHWVEDPLPSEVISEEVNSAAVLGERARRCRDEAGQIPTLVMVDHYAVGDLFSVVDELNQVGAFAPE